MSKTLLMVLPNAYKLPLQHWSAGGAICWAYRSTEQDFMIGACCVDLPDYLLHPLGTGEAVWIFTVSYYWEHLPWGCLPEVQTLITI